METFTYNKLFARKVALLCCDHYKTSIKKTGKPQNKKEWTILASIVAELRSHGSTPVLRVVAMGTGSKCLGQNKLSKNGDLIHDSHAEVIARRAFIRFLYRELEQIYNGSTSAYIERCPEENVKCRIKSGVYFHFYTSQTPCGDAAIFPLKEEIKSDLSDLIGQTVTPPGADAQTEVNPLKRRLPGASKSDCTASKTHCDGVSSIHTAQKESNEQEHNVSKLKENSEAYKQLVLRELLKPNCDGGKKDDIPPGLIRSENSNINSVPEDRSHVDTHRTGAKCVSGDKQDPGLTGACYHVTGVLRTKPGRGDRTLSMSCSDKLALWNLLGVQGALITIFIQEPIYLKSITIGKCLCDLNAIHRAVLDRTKLISDLPPPYHHHSTVILHDDSHTFEHSRELIEAESCGLKTGPSAASIIWWLDGDRGRQEASVNGRRQGVVAKNWDKPIARCCICPYELFKQFIVLTKKLTSEEKEQLNVCSSSKTYLACKSCAINYQQAKILVLKSLSSWLRTPHEYYQFICDD